MVKHIKSKYTQNYKKNKDKNLNNEKEKNKNDDDKDTTILAIKNENEYSYQIIKLETFIERVIIRIPRKYFLFQQSLK